jgi:hypothetical protein
MQTAQVFRVGVLICHATLMPRKFLRACKSVWVAAVQYGSCMDIGTATGA